MKKMKIRYKLLACLTALVLLVGCSGCAMEKEKAEQIPEQTDSLVVYAGPYTAKFLNMAVKLFSIIYPDINVEVRDFGDYSDYQNQQNYMEVLKSELAAGTGPDLILFTPVDFEDIQKTAGSGAFQNISGYIENDAGFSLENYNSGVMEAGVYNGQRLFVPISYSINLFLTTEETLNKESWKLPSDLQELYSQMTEFGQLYRSNTERFFSHYPLYSFLLESSGIPVADWISKEIKVDDEAFRDFMSAYKELYSIDWKRYEEGIYVKDPNYTYTGDTVKLIRNNKIQYIFESYHPSLLSDYAALLNDQTPVYAAFPSLSGKPVATIDMAAAVNRNGANKANAYNLLKIMLSEKMQTYGSENFCLYYDIPVLDGVYKKLLEEQNRKYAGGGTPDGSIRYALIPDDTINSFVSLVSDVTCSNISPQVQSFVWEEMKSYFEDQKSYEQCLESLRNKLELYINE